MKNFSLAGGIAREPRWERAEIMPRPDGTKASSTFLGEDVSITNGGVLFTSDGERMFIAMQFIHSIRGAL